MNQQSKLNKESLFSPVTDGEDRRQVWEQLVDSKQDVRLYSERGDCPIYDSLRLIEYSKRGLVFSGLPQELAGLPPEQNLITFILKGARYFSQIFQPTLARGTLKVPLPTSLFKVNRRANFRVLVPHNFTLVVSVLAINGKSGEWHFQLRDLSFGGCCLFLPEPQSLLKVGDRLDLRLQLDARMVVTTSGDVRYVRSANSGMKGWLVGLQFDPNSSNLSGDLFTMVLSLYRRAQSYAEI